MSQEPGSSRPANAQAQSEGDEDVPSMASTELQFLTFTNLDQTTDPETKKKVRSHVQHRVQRTLRNRKQIQRGGEIILDISSLSQVDAGPSECPAVRNSSMLGPTTTLHPYGLGAGRSDPFTPFPIVMNVRTHELYDHLHGKTCPMFQTLNRIGFFQTVLDEAAFRQVLCTSSSHITMLRGGTENAEAIVLSNEAIRSINKRIADPTLCTSDGVIATILAFACHAVMFNDVQGTLTHFNGLEAIIRRRGGLEALRYNPVVRTVIFWIDVNTAFLHDRVPRYPAPDDILPRIDNRFLGPPPSRIIRDACVTDELISAMEELIVLNQFIIRELTIRDLWDDGVFAGLHVVPLMSNLLSIRPNMSEPNSNLERQESCRLGALLYLSSIRRKFGVSLLPDVYIPKLKQTITVQYDPNMEEKDSVLLWLLVLGGTISLTHEDHSWFVSSTAEIIVRRQYSTWMELMTSVHKVLWIEGLLEAESNEFHREVSSKAWISYSHIFL